MPISLKHINTSDSDSIKLDDVNYNFDQLVANGGGPRGPQGPIGETGTQGTSGKEGVQGPIGDTGFQGTQGAISDNYWKKINSGVIEAETLIPIHTTGDHFAPVIKIGYVETDLEYGEKLQLVGGKTPYQWNINRRPYSSSNLQFLNSAVLGKQYDFQLKAISKKNQMTIGFLDPTNSTSIYISEGVSFKSSNSIGSADSLYVSSSESFFKNATVFNSPAVIKDNLIIENALADTDKVAICSDDTGLVKFKSIQEIEGTVPFGTIISIAPSIFSENGNFINSETVVPDNDFPLQLSVGKGVGSYTGWYLCNGKEWTNGVDSYQVPSLGQFNYTIDDNSFTATSNSQGGASSSPSLPIHITGGSDVNMTATSQSISVYNVTSTVSTSSVNASASAGTTFRIKQLPQIIYLNDADLYWSDAGTGQNPAVPLTFLLDDANTTASKLSPDPYTFKNITNQGEGDSYTFTTTITAPLGYYWLTPPDPEDITGLPGYATITGVTLGSGTKPTTINVSVSIVGHPSTTTVSTLNINTTPFIISFSVEITLNRHDGITPVVKYSYDTPESTPIQYNFVTGYTFQLVLTANAGYTFKPSQFQGIFGLISYDGGLLWSPPAGGGTITIIDYALSNAGTTLEINLSLTGVPLTGYLTTQGYTIFIDTYNTLPSISYKSGNYINITNGDGQGFVSQDMYISNNTSSTVYIFIGIQQYLGPLLIPVSSTISAGYYTLNIIGFVQDSVSVTAQTATNTYYSPTSITLLPGGTLYGTFYRNATSDNAHSVSMYWSSTPTGITKTLLTYIP